ncbi:MAG: glycosyltransferase [Actinomycetota bacterium]
MHVVASRQRRGAEMFAADLIRDLRASGIEQAVVVVNDRGPSQLVFDAPTHFLAPGGLGPSSLGRRPAALRALVKRLEPRIVQAHGGEAFKHAVVATRGASATLVYRRIGSTPRWMAGDFRRAGLRLLMGRADAIVAVADALRIEMIEEFGVPPHRVVVIPNGVDLTRALPERDRNETLEELGLDANDRVIIVVGALNEEKNPLGALEAAVPALTGPPFATIVFVGDGPLRGQVREEARSRGLSERVRFLGVRTDIADLLGASDVLLMSSRTEGMPGAAIEAGIAGLPVVAPRLAGLPEVVVHGETGILTPAGDTAALGAAVSRLLEDEDERRRLGEAGRKRCIARHDIKVVAARYLTLYDDLLPSTLHESRG